MNILIITYRYPPSGGPGVVRPMKLVKYLKQLGASPVVLCADGPFIRPKDRSLLNEIPAGIEVHRVFSGENPFWTLAPYLLRVHPKRMHYPDHILLWRQLALKRAESLIREKKIRVVMTFFPPESSHLIGLQIKKRCGLPWIADYRDPWTYQYFYPTASHKSREMQMEKLVIEQADHFTFGSDIMKENLIRQFQVPPEKCTVVYNGIDPDDFLPLSPTGKLLPDPERFVVLYAGVFKKYCANETLLYALKEAAQTCPDFARQAVFYKIGSNRWPFYRSLMAELGRIMEVHDGGYIPYHECLRMGRDSDCLVLTLPSDDPASPYCTRDINYTLQWIPSKLFNYLGAQRRVLGIVPLQSTTARIIRETRCGDVVAPDDHQGIVKALLVHFESWQKGVRNVELNEQALQPYDRKYQAGQILEICRRLACGGAES